MNTQHSAGKCSLIGIALLLAVAAPTLAQRSTPGPPPVDKTTNKARQRQQDEASREWQLRNFGNPSVVKDRRRLDALMAQTEEDFTRLLTLHNELARAIASDKPLDYHFVSQATGEIRKRATSIQSNIGLTLPAEEIKPLEMPAQTNEKEMKEALVKLCKQIRSFVTNPVIEQPNTIDVEKLATAKRDLESVIQLSEHLKRDADQLGGKAQK
ncbi:MAG TPA: hypothetical protein VJT15_00165 [Pyrinomonadaceae bacterium]|nr:hypothetical protein [Pyrinomonadaceae bacterium]